MYANVVGLDRPCRIHFLHETVSVRLLSSSRRSDRCSQRRPVTNFCCHRRRKLSQNTHQTPPRQYRQVHSGRLLSRSRSTVFRRNLQTHQSPQNQQRRRNQSNLVPLHSFRPRLRIVISIYIIHMHRHYDKFESCRTLRLSKRLAIFSSLKREKARQ